MEIKGLILVTDVAKKIGCKGNIQISQEAWAQKHGFDIKLSLPHGHGKRVYVSEKQYKEKKAELVELIKARYARNQSKMVEARAKKAEMMAKKQQSVEIPSAVSNQLDLLFDTIEGNVEPQRPPSKLFTQLERIEDRQMFLLGVVERVERKMDRILKEWGVDASQT